MAKPRRYDISLTPDPVIEAYKKDVDRTLLRENPKLTHEERLQKLLDLQALAVEVRHAGRAARMEALHEELDRDQG